MDDQWWVHFPSGLPREGFPRQAQDPAIKIANGPTFQPMNGKDTPASAGVLECTTPPTRSRSLFSQSLTEDRK